MSCVHGSQGRLDPASDDLLSEVEIVCRLAEKTLCTGDQIPWGEFAEDYDRIRDRIEAVIPGFTDFNQRAREPGGFVLPHPPRDLREFRTENGRAHFTVNRLDVLEVPPGRLLLQTMRSHDQFNTTIYGLNDRYRGIKGGRRVLLVNPDDLAELGHQAGQIVDLVSEFSDGVERRADRFKLVSYPTARGCAAAYYPETNGLIPLDSVAEGSNTPTSKSVIVRLELHGAPAEQTGSPERTGSPG